MKLAVEEPETEARCGYLTSSADRRVSSALLSVRRTVDAIHVATAMASGDDLESIVTHDERKAEV